MRKSILFVTQAQFGLLIDYYQYSLHLKEKYEIEYICWDYNKRRVDIEGVKVFYVSRNGSLLKRNIRFIKAILHITKVKAHDKILLHYFRGCSFVPLLRKTENLFLDIRTSNVSRSRINRILNNILMWIECFFYKNLSVISVGVKKRLWLPKKTVVIPLGANYINVDRKDKNGLHLLYIGTLSNRNIDQTLEGLSDFRINHKSLDLSYTIIGSGNKKSTEKLMNAIRKYNLKEVVKVLGYKPYDELIAYFKESNIGISYVPITNYFNYQPVTKTFEYLMSGMPVIATSTFENKLIINDSNGILIEDNAKSFCDGLIKISNIMQSYESTLIKSQLEDCQWSNIALKLEDYLF